MPKAGVRTREVGAEPAEPGLARIEWWAEKILAQLRRGETVQIPHRMAAVLGLARAEQSWRREQAGKVTK